MDKELEIILSLYLDEHENSDHDKMLAEYLELNPLLLEEVKDYLRDHVALHYLLGEESDNLTAKLENILGAQFNDGDKFSENIKNKINSRKKGKVVKLSDTQAVSASKIRRLKEKNRREMRRKMILAFSMAAAALLAVTLFLFSGKNGVNQIKAYEVSSITGRVTVSQGSEKRRLKIGDSLRAGDSVRGEEGCELTVFSEKGDSVELSGEGEFDISTDNHRHLKLRSGRLLLGIKSDKMTVESRDVRAAASDASFALAAVESQTTLKCLKGVIDVEDLLNDSARKLYATDNVSFPEQYSYRVEYVSIDDRRPIPLIESLNNNGEIDLSKTEGRSQNFIIHVFEKGVELKKNCRLNLNFTGPVVYQLDWKGTKTNRDESAYPFCLVPDDTSLGDRFMPITGVSLIKGGHQFRIVLFRKNVKLYEETINFTVK